MSQICPELRGEVGAPGHTGLSMARREQLPDAVAVVRLSVARDLVRWHGAGLAIGQMTLGVTRRRVSRCGCRISSGEARRSSGFVTMQHARTNGKHGGGS